MATHDPFAVDRAGVTERSETTLHRRWALLLLLGIVQLIGGMMAVAIPAAATLAAVIVFGAILIASGVAQIVHAFSVKDWKGVTLQALSGLLYVAAGILVLVFPMTGILTLTIVVAVLLIADGVVRSWLAYQVKPLRGSGWFLAAGIASLALGVLLLIGWPLTGFWAIGLLLGVSLVFGGVTNCVLSIMFRSRVARDSERGLMEGAHRHA